MPNNARVHYGTGKLAAVLSIRVEPHQVKNPVIMVVHNYFFSYMAFCGWAFEESSDTLHCNTE